MSNFFAARAIAVAAVALIAAPSPPPAPVPSPVVPLVTGLTIVTAVTNVLSGDEETVKTVTSTAPGEGMTVMITGDVTIADGKKEQIAVTRHVLATDLKNSHSYKYLFTTGDQPEFVGTTAISVSAGVLADIHRGGKTEFAVNGEAQGIGGLMSAVFATMTSGDKTHVMSLGPNASGTLSVVEKEPVSFAVLLNGERVNLQAWHLKSVLEKGDNPVSVECWILDDPANPLMLRYLIDKQKLQVIRIDVPTADNGKSIENALTTEKRAILYGVYFDFNSAELKPQSTAVLRQVADIMQREPSWKLRIEGHTDSVGGDAAANKALSAKRAEAVKAALVERGVASARLDTQGFGASSPRETNNTLQGRARNRRVELTRE